MDRIKPSNVFPFVWTAFVLGLWGLMAFLDAILGGSSTYVSGFFINLMWSLIFWILPIGFYYLCYHIMKKITIRESKGKVKSSEFLRWLVIAIFITFIVIKTMLFLFFIEAGFEEDF